MSSILVTSLAVGCGGFFGALARYGLVVALTRDGVWPWATFAANLLGCFALGALRGWLERSGAPVTPALALALTTGFLGAFTTFSTFAVESVDLAATHRIWGVGYVAASVVGGLGLAWLGMRWVESSAVGVS